jgi:thermitase
MKLYSFFFTVLIGFVFFLPNHRLITTENINKSLYSKDHFIIKLKSAENLLTPAAYNQFQNDENIIQNIADKYSLKIKRIKKLFPQDKFHFNELAKKYETDKYYVIFLNGEYSIPEVCNKFESVKKVDFAEPDFIGESASKSSRYNIVMKPNDEFYGRQWGLNNDGNVKTTTGRSGKKGADLNVEKGWDVETGNESVIVAILDSGSKLDHPDLAGRFWINTKELRNGRDNDGNGFAEDINGWNFAYENNDVRDDGGHGTNISGTIGAVTNNSLGYAGIDQKCKLMICKDLDDENLGEYSWWSSALYYAANNGAKVINMSEGGYDYSKTLATAIDYAYDAGCLIVASMMNKNNSDTYYPAAFKNVMAIGATDTDDGRCRQFTWGGGSNWGKHISVVAPGNRIYGLDYKDDNNYDVYWSGTSQATAYVSGVASLLLAQDITRTNKVLKEIITSTAKDQVGDPREDVPGWDEYYGWGRVDLYAALTYNSSTTRKKDLKDNGNKMDGVNNGNHDDNNANPAKADEPNSDHPAKKENEVKKARKGQ